MSDLLELEKTKQFTENKKFLLIPIANLNSSLSLCHFLRGRVRV